MCYDVRSFANGVLNSYFNCEKKDIEDTVKMCYYSIMPTGATSLPPLSK